MYICAAYRYNANPAVQLVTCTLSTQHTLAALIRHEGADTAVHNGSYTVQAPE